jgi:serine/threonine protein phosphatase 1
MTAPIYAIGDIHGQREMLEHALDKIERDGGKDARVVFLGDYVDRGPDCKGVLDILIDGKAQGKDWITLMGNHDRMFAMFMRDYPVTDSRLLVGYDWFHDRIGGVETLASYGVEVTERSRIFQIHAAARNAVPQSHVEFLNTLPTNHEEPGLLFVHAGIRPGVALTDQTEEDLVWIREEFLDDPRPHPWLVVHGHTPVKQATHAGNHVNLDTGAGYGKPLSTAVFEGTDCWLLTDKGRDPLTP